MLELKNIKKWFPGVLALDDVSLSFKEGEIHALLGENGAGKSTIMNIICGNFRQDEGVVLIDGNEMNFKSYQDAIKNKISIVNQEIQVIPDSTVAENIMLDKLSNYSKNGKLNWKHLNSDTQKYLDMVGLNIAPETLVYKLSAAHKQLSQIAKALASNAKYLLLDEPTSSLTIHEANNLFGLLKKLRAEGVTIIFVSHKIEEVLAICDMVSVLRDGKYVGTKSCEGLTKQEIIKMMIGRETVDVYLGELCSKCNETVLEVKDLCQTGRFEDINFHLQKGEILGFYGLVGSGRTELAKIIIGEDHYTSGNIFVNGKNASIKSVSDCLYKYNMGYISENRKEEGLILDFPLKENVTITIWNKLRNNATRYLSNRKIDAVSEKMVNALEIKTPSIRQVVRNLSGGNQQKVCISKWLAAECEILIIDEPTIGVDVGAKKQIHDLIWKLANEQGKSIILISSDMPEMVMLARRILIFRENKIVGELDALDQYRGNYKQISEEIGKHLA